MTHTVLRIDASARTEGSVSRALADDVIARLSPTLTTVRDLGGTVPQIDTTWLAANTKPEADRNEQDREALRLSDQMIAEILAADTLVVSTPIYNFGVPAALKAWFDQVARAGITFEYTPDGPRGLLSGKRAILVVASGGTEVGSPIDFATPWLRHVLGFIGITDIQIVRSDRLMIDAPASQARAAQDIAALAA